MLVQNGMGETSLHPIGDVKLWKFNEKAAMLICDVGPKNRMNIALPKSSYVNLDLLYAITNQHVNRIASSD